jgi:hypothetical protein
MPTLKDVAVMTSELDRLSGELHAELTEGEIDFEKMVRLSDSISENADRLAGAFSTMAEALQTSLASSENGDGDSSDDDSGES